MLIDAERESDSLPALLDKTYDACIIGGGVAGITLAVKLAEKQKQVLLLEAGELDVSEISQAVYQGKNAGFDYFPLDEARLRFLGGTSNHWAGWSRPLDPFDFKPRDYLPESGWPISHEDLKSYYPETCAILGIEPFGEEPAFGDRFRRFEFRYSDVLFKDKYLEKLKTSPNITTILNANVLDVPLDESGSRIRQATFRNYSEDAVHQAKATDYILAMGGIENARFLLNATGDNPKGLGNTNDQVGRYFMEHLIYAIGYYVLTDKGKQHFPAKTAFYSPTEDFMRRAQINNIALRIYHAFRQASVASKLGDWMCESESLKDFYKTLGLNACSGSWMPSGAGVFGASSEQAPNAKSRVKLTDEKDRFGKRRIALDWQFHEIDKTTFRKAGLAMGEQFAKSDVGRIKLFDWVMRDGVDDFPTLDTGQEVAGYHHMGTTRMGRSAADGVVDQNGRLFEVENGYVAGSSVFRTGGHANPTFNIVSLALRMAEHLSR